MTKMKNMLLLLAVPALLLSSCSGNNNNGSSSKEDKGNFVSATASYGEDNSLLYGDRLDKEDFHFTVQYEKGTVDVKPDEFDVSLSSDTFTTENIEATLSLKEDSTIKTTITLTPKVRDSLKLLFIGNSFSDDTIQWMYEIADDLGIDLLVENMYIGGCSIDTHYSNILYDRPNYQWVHRVGNSWVRTSSYRLSVAITSQDWDFISFQQASGVSGVESSYGNLYRLLQETELLLQDPDHTQFVWNMTWAYQGDSTHSDFGKYSNNQTIMYKAICRAVQSEVLPIDKIATVIPNGTAIQNARTSYVGDHLTRDGYHLTEDLGRYIVGMNALKTLTGVDINDCGFTTVNKGQTLIAKESVDNSQLSKYTVTLSQYQADPLSLDEIQKTHHLRATAFQRGFYNATDSANPTRIFYDASSSFDNQFACSDIIPISEFVDGTIIYIKPGYKYRPEAWRSLTAPIDVRPALTQTTFVEVTDTWRSNYSHRAFNISRTDSAQLTEAEIQDIVSGEIFAIYLPN